MIDAIREREIGAAVVEVLEDSIGLGRRVDPSDCWERVHVGRVEIRHPDDDEVWNGQVVIDELNRRSLGSRIVRELERRGLVVRKEGSSS